MRSLVVFVAVLALSVAAPSDETALKKRSIGHLVAYDVPTAVVAEPVVEARAVYAGPAVYAPAATVYSSGSAVSHQSRVDVRTSPAVVASAPAVVASPALVEAAPVVEARSLYSSPLYAAPAAVSHQSRVDVRTSPAIVASAPAVVASPVVVEAAPVVEARSLYSAPLYAAPAAVSHQSRYDVRTSPAVISDHVVGPAVYGQHLVSAPAVVDARSVWSPSLYATSW